VARVVVDVMLKPEILDPQGQAIANALPSLGFSGITAVRQGKRFEVEVAGDLTADALAEITLVAGTLLSNPVIEDFAIRGELTEETAFVGDLPSPAEAAGTVTPHVVSSTNPAAEAAAQEQYPPAGPTSDRDAKPVAGAGK
jgi:phosphoribosylformylglycinamidine synthase PurS subunit